MALLIHGNSYLGRLTSEIQSSPAFLKKREETLNNRMNALGQIQIRNTERTS